ncbi:thiopurine S-methyltransferase [Granulosicoccus antarcticus]|uniref:Thiopurine S-methyltransferase n=1 Tax=Granulosicoccus antarcticus IMCC3135 TaxID=1192854 RepID=A0A2Z2P1J8_9GAMM|nr:thiopurine S-methyltransferase [Granulosicoccus antarcticus]ASJ76411.1 Thiopurine S-methyltransferase [Granulosicoccus antarcticus IMCC3135]
MQAEYWLSKWSEDKIGFHQDTANKRLQKYWASLELSEGAPVFVPLCGKSLDILWLHQSGHPVLGVELSEKAVKSFFEENALPYERREEQAFIVYSGTGQAQGIDLLVGDFFALTPNHLAQCHAFYDRAAMIALEEDMRARYTGHLAQSVATGTKGLLLTIAYDQSRMAGPPFSVSDQNVQALHGNDFDLVELAHYSGPERLGNLAERGLETLDERVYLLTRNR